MTSATPTPYYSFDAQLKVGSAGAEKIDKYFSKWYEIYTVVPVIDKIGIDRIWVHRITKVRYTVEYKTDVRYAETGNIFVETVSVNTDGKPGWAYTCGAQILVVYSPQLNEVFIGPTTGVKKLLKSWTNDYREVKVDNKNYKTAGIPVPANEFVKAMYWHLNLSDTGGKDGR